jgi:hypothetical protein
MDTKRIAGAVALAVLIAGVSFWGGMAYAKSHASAAFRAGAGGAQFFAASGGNRTFRTAGGGATAGSIIAKDATSVTVKSPDGSTKIILLGSNTQVMKAATGTLDDLSVGANVTITGSANSDGSISAETISLRPAGAAPQTTGPGR